MKFKALPVHDLTDATLNFEQLQPLLPPAGPSALISPSGHDDTAAINGSLQGSPAHTLLLPGNYRVDGTITIPASTELTLSHGAVLLRQSAYSASTAPVVNLNGATFSKLTGGGRVQTQNASPNGVVLVGPATKNSTSNVQFWKIGGIEIVGQATFTSTDLGLNIWSSQAAVGDGGTGLGTNYYGLAKPSFIGNVGEGVRFDSQANAHQLYGFRSQNILTYVVRFRGQTGGVLENLLIGGFACGPQVGAGHVTVLQFERAVGHMAFLAGEPDDSVAGSTFYSLDANSTNNILIGFSNNMGGTDSGTLNTLLISSNTAATAMFKTQILQAIRGTTTFTTNGAGGGIELDNSGNTVIDLQDSSQGANAKRSRIISTGGQTQFGCVNDAYNAAATAFSYTNAGGGTPGIGFYGHAPVAQPAAPVTLADVIAVIRGCGLSA